MLVAPIGGIGRVFLKRYWEQNLVSLQKQFVRVYHNYILMTLTTADDLEQGGCNVAI